MPTCARCRTEIGAGKNFCITHYLEAQERYRQDVIDYQRRLSEWENLSFRERQNANESAEQSSITWYAFLLGLIVGGGGGFFITTHYSLDGLYGVIFAIAITLSFSMLQPLRAVAGRLMRAVSWSIVIFIIFAISIGILKSISKLVAENSTVLNYGSAIAAITISLVMEFRGAYHASAAPSKPSPPHP